MYNSSDLFFKKKVFFLSAGTEASPPISPMDKTKVFYIAVGVACSIILIIALAVAAIHVHSMPNPNKDGTRLVYIVPSIQAIILPLFLHSYL